MPGKKAGGQSATSDGGVGMARAMCQQEAKLRPCELRLFESLGKHTSTRLD